MGWARLRVVVEQGAGTRELRSATFTVGFVQEGAC